MGDKNGLLKRITSTEDIEHPYSMGRPYEQLLPKNGHYWIDGGDNVGDYNIELWDTGSVGGNK